MLKIFQPVDAIVVAKAVFQGGLLLGREGPHAHRSPVHPACFQGAEEVAAAYLRIPVEVHVERRLGLRGVCPPHGSRAETLTASCDSDRRQQAAEREMA